MAAFEQVGIQAVIKGLGDYKRGSKDIDRANEKMGKSSVEVAEKSRKMQKVLARMGPMAGLAFAAVGVAAVKMAMDVEKAFAEVQTLLPTISEEGFGKLKADLMALSSEMGIATNQMIPALYQAISAGVPPENVIDFLRTGSKAAVGGITDLKTAVDGITSVVNAYGAELINAAKASDIMFTGVRLGKTTFEELSSSLFNVIPVASAAGVSFEEITAALAALTAVGVPTRVATTQLRQAILSLSAPTKAQQVLFQKLGLEMNKEKLESEGLVNVMLELVTATEGDMAALRELVGSTEAVQAVLALTKNEGAKFNEMLSEMEGSLGATDAAFETMEQTMSRKLEKAIVILKNRLTELGLVALPVIADGLVLATGLMLKMSAAAEKGVNFIAKYKEAFLAFAVVLAAPALMAGVAQMAALGATLARLAVLSFTNLVAMVQLLASVRTGTQLMSVVGMFTRMAGPLALGGIAVAAGLAVAGIVLLVGHLRKGRDMAEEMAKKNEKLLETFKELGRKVDLGFITKEMGDAETAVKAWIDIIERVTDAEEEYARMQARAALAEAPHIRFKILKEAGEGWRKTMDAMILSMAELLETGQLTDAQLEILRSTLKRGAEEHLTGTNALNVFSSAEELVGERAGTAAEQLEELPEVLGEVGTEALTAQEPLSDFNQELKDVAEWAAASDEALKPMIETLKGLEGVLTPEVAALDAKIAALKEDIVLAELAEGADSARIPPLRELIAGLELEKSAITTALDAMFAKVLAQETLNKAEEGEVRTLDELFEKIGEVGRAIGIDTEAEWGLAAATEEATETLGDEVEVTGDVIEATDDFKRSLEEAARQGDQTAEDMLAAMAESEEAILGVEEQADETKTAVEELGDKTLEQAPKFGELERVGRTAMDNIASSAYGTRDAIRAIEESADTLIGKLRTILTLQTNVAQGEGQAGIPGFQGGGVVPGPIGKPVLAMVHGGERIISVGQRNAFDMPISVSLQGADWVGIRRAIDAQLDVALDTARSRSLRAGATVTGGIG